MTRRMTNIVLNLGFLIASATGSLLAQSSTSPVPKGMILIDGQKNPELIPQWMLWRETFRTLTTAKKNDLVVILEPMSVDDAC